MKTIKVELLSQTTYVLSRARTCLLLNYRITTDKHPGHVDGSIDSQGFVIFQTNDKKLAESIQALQERCIKQALKQLAATNPATQNTIKVGI